MANAPEHYRRRMERVAAAIAAALREGRQPTLEQLAAAAALSPFHFHRVYRLLTGETVGQSVQRLKVTQALELVSGGDSVTGAALAVGYASGQNLGKAVKRRTGSSVTELRGAPDGTSLTNPRPREAVMRFEIVDHAPITIACRQIVGPYDELNLAYRALFTDVCAAVAPAALTGVYGIPIDDSRDVDPAEHRFVAALAVPQDAAVAHAADVRELGGGRHAVARAAATYADLPVAIDRFYEQLLDAGIALGNGETFLHYVDQPGAADGPDVVHLSDIYLPIEA